ncbi:hypothetical protein Tco_1500583 [Tanacetum coccineum]
MSQLKHPHKASLFADYNLSSRLKQWVWSRCQYGVSSGLDMAYRGFLGVETTLDIFQNIHILYLQYGVLVFSGYGVLILFPSWSLVRSGTDTPYLLDGYGVLWELLVCAHVIRIFIRLGIREPTGSHTTQLCEETIFTFFRIGEEDDEEILMVFVGRSMKKIYLIQDIKSGLLRWKVAEKDALMRMGHGSSFNNWYINGDILNITCKAKQIDGQRIKDTMADMNIPANDVPAEQAPAIAPPTRTDDQILPLRKWVPVGKSNYVLDVLKSQRNPIFKVAVAILKNTNFFRAFTASSSIPAIYIQQFWDTMRYDSTTGIYSCQLDEQWFNLHKDILRDALQITPINDNNPFVAPPSSDAVIEYVNTLGYPCMLKNVSAMSVNDLYQPWRAILSMINMCLTGKTAGHDRPRHPVLQILWGIIHRSNIDYAERI